MQLCDRQGKLVITVTVRLLVCLGGEWLCIERQKLERSLAVELLAFELVAKEECIGGER